MLSISTPYHLANSHTSVNCSTPKLSRKVEYKPHNSTGLLTQKDRGTNFVNTPIGDACFSNSISNQKKKIYANNTPLHTYTHTEQASMSCKVVFKIEKKSVFYKWLRPRTILAAIRNTTI
jgi:hypothetical protein